MLAEGETERGRLEPRLGEFALGVRVGDDAATGVVANDAARYNRRPDGEAELEVATRVEEAEGAGVRAARDRLELADDFHGAHLGRAGDRAAREGRAQKLGETHVRPHPTDDRGHQMMYRRVALDARVRLDRDRPA